MAARIKDRIRDFKKMFKENWKLFKQSKLGLIGLGIIIFFVLIAVLAPVIPYASERDPVHWRAPPEDKIAVETLWTNSTGGTVITVPVNASAIYPIYDTPTGLLSDGNELNEFLDEGRLSSAYLEVVYLSTGSVGKGVRDISPMDGQFVSLKGEKITSVIPDNIGPVVSSVRIYHDKTITTTSGAPLNSVIFITTSSGNIVAINAHGDPPIGLSEDLYTMDYSFRWMRHIDDSITHSACIFYGSYGYSTDDKVIVAGDNGTVAAYSIGGVQEWSQHLSGNGFYEPIPVDVSDMVILVSKDGYVYGLNATTGAVEWNKHFNATFSAPYMSKYYDNNMDRNATCLVGTENGHLYGIRIYDYGNKSAGDLEFDITVLDGAHISDVYCTADNPDTQEVYFGVSTPSGDSHLYSLRASDLWSGDLNTALKWEYTEKNADIHARVQRDPKTGYVFFALDDGVIYSMNNTGAVILKDKVHEGSVLNTPLLSMYVPGSEFSNVPGVMIATTKEGYMQAFSSTGKYLAPLPPGTYPSGNTYILGTDAYGRDIFSQLIWGSRIALLVGFAASFLSVLIGVIVGIVAGYSGGWVDVVLMRFTDVVLVMPFLPLIIVLAAVMGPSIWNIILAITLVGWPGTARIIRSQVLSLKERPFIDAARVTGASNTRIMFRHIMPNVLPLAFLYMTFAVTGAILGEASLSFIGLGDPNTMSWGMMLYYVSHGYTLTAWWWMLPPGIAITFLVLGFFLVGRAFEEIINPRLRRRR